MTWICDKCNKEFASAKECAHHEKDCGFVNEIKCKCKECGNIWHYLSEEEKNIRSQAKSNALIGLGNLFTPTGAFFSNKSIDAQKELTKFSKCPKCGSANIIKENHNFEKN